MIKILLSVTLIFILFELSAGASNPLVTLGIDGIWKGNITEGNKVSNAEITIHTKGNIIEGTMIWKNPNTNGPKFITIELKGAQTTEAIVLSGTINMMFPVQINLEGTIQSNEFSGNFSTSISKGTFRLIRFKGSE